MSERKLTKEAEKFIEDKIEEATTAGKPHGEAVEYAYREARAAGHDVPDEPLPKHKKAK